MLLFSSFFLFTNLITSNMYAISHVTHRWVLLFVEQLCDGMIFNHDPPRCFDCWVSVIQATVICLTMIWKHLVPKKPFFSPIKSWWNMDIWPLDLWLWLWRSKQLMFYLLILVNLLEIISSYHLEIGRSPFDF